jgi:hypothetical protein
MSSLVKQDGGSILADLQNLAIPFSLLLAKNGLEYLSKKSVKSDVAPKGKGRGKGKRAQRGGESESMNSGQVAELQNDMKAYLGGFK